MHLSDETREALEREVLGSEFRRYFDDTLRRDAGLKAFGSPADLLASLHSAVEDYSRKDAALGALLRAYQGGGPERAAVGSLLLLSLWPGLRAIVRSKWDQFHEKDVLWAEVHWAFLETAWHFPLDRRPARIASNLKLDTLQRLCGVQREQRASRDAVRSLVEAAEREGEASQATTLTDPASLAERLDGEDRGDLGHELTRACDRAVGEGLITDLDRLLILGTRLYGHELKAYAREQGLAYEMAKKRRQRAEQSVRRILRRGKGL